MLPSHVLENSCGNLVSIECKNGDFYTGILDKCDHFMNCKLKDVVIVKPSQEPIVQLKAEDVYVKGNCVKCIRLNKEALDKPKSDKKSNYNKKNNRSGQRGGRGANRGRGRSRGRGHNSSK
eukprot:NODE_225_length_12315_cov_1.300671.p9 type:complete len:121 gc:universal NODE_225_length_12315_cov_1.300671:9026-8664(-)